MSAVVRLTASYLIEYVRRPMNTALLVLVPLIFVALAADAIADFAGIVGGVEDASLLAAPTAGWAAAFLAGVAGFFHVLGSRSADRRLAHAGMGPIRVLTARVASGVVLALLASAAALVALGISTGLGDPLRAISGTVLFATIYLGLGVAVGAIVRSDVNGSLVVIFVWMLDVFLGPAMGGGGAWVTRLFPSHFVTLVMLDSASGHGGPIGDLGWALMWAVGAMVVAGIVFSRGTRNAVEHAAHRRPSTARRVAAGLRYGFIEYRRNAAMWVLLVALPVFFITLSFIITPNDPAPVELTEGGVTSVRVLSMIDVHGAIMVPITVGFLAGLAGLFVIQGSLDADARLALAGFKTREILTSRMGVVVMAGAVTTVVSLAVTALDFAPESWLWFAAGNGLVAVTYGLIGVLVGVPFGRLGGLYVMFLLPFIDIGLAQNVMFSAAPPAWGAGLPGRGAVRVLVDAAFTPSFDGMTSLLASLAWIAVLVVAAGLAFRSSAAPRRA